MIIQTAALAAAAATTSSTSSSSSSSSSSWKMLVSQYVAFETSGLSSSSDDDDDENAMQSTWFPFDNTSNNYCYNNYWSTYGEANCPRTTLIWSILRGLKRILARVANSYYAMPVVLFLMPLIMGIVCGIWCGRRWERNIQKRQSYRRDETSISMMTRVAKRISKSRIGVITTVCHVLAAAFWRVWSLLLSIVPLVMVARASHLNDDVPLLKTSMVPADDKASPDATSTTTTTTPTPTTTLLGIVEKSDMFDEERDEQSRIRLRQQEGSEVRESGVALELVPKHVAVIMDGNRRYGRSKYQNATKGHRDGSETLVEFAKWCCVEGVQVLTVFAFSTENWQRDPAEVAALMQLFCQYCDELRVEALQRNIRLRVLSTDDKKIPLHVKVGLDRMQRETQHCQGGLTMNICLSYGSRGEILNACKSLIRDVQSNQIQADAICEEDLQRRLLTSHCGDPDVLIRTSGEVRLSNFLLWQSAYTEFFFLPHAWPEVKKADLLHVIRTYAQERQRRFGK